MRSGAAKRSSLLVCKCAVQRCRVGNRSNLVRVKVHCGLLDLGAGCSKAERKGNENGQTKGNATGTCTESDGEQEDRKMGKN